MTLEGLLSFGAVIIDARRLWYKSTAAAKPVAGGIAILKAGVLTGVILLGWITATRQSPRRTLAGSLEFSAGNPLET